MKKTLTKATLIENLSYTKKITRQHAEFTVDSFFKALIECFVRGENVRISGFGNFVLRDKKSRFGRNPKTGKEAMINARRVITFRPGQKLKARVAAYNTTIQE